SGGPLYDVLQRSVMLDEIEICGGDGAQGHAEIANDGNSFEKNFGQEHSGTPIEIYAARMHFFHEGTEEAEIVVGGCAEHGAVGRGMHVREVGADGEVNGDGNLALIGGEENAGGGVGRIEFARGEKFSGGFAVANAGVRGGVGNFVEESAGFAGHAECTGTEAGFDVFGSVAAESDFEIVDEGGAVHGNAGDKAAADEVVDDWAKAGFDDVAAHA